MLNLANDLYFWSIFQMPDRENFWVLLYQFDRFRERSSTFILPHLRWGFNANMVMNAREEKREGWSFSDDNCSRQWGISKRFGSPQNRGGGVFYVRWDGGIKSPSWSWVPLMKQEEEDSIWVSFQFFFLFFFWGGGVHTSKSVLLF